MPASKKNDYKNKKRQKHRKLQHNNVANGGLTPKINSVLRHYFQNGYNQQLAMLSAGYSAVTAKNATHQIFGRPDVKRAIEAHEQELNRKFQINEEWVVRRLMLLADGSTGQILRKLRANDYDLNALSDEELYFLNEFTEETVYESAGRGMGKIAVGEKLKIKGSDRLAALNMLARKLGLFKEDNEQLGMGSIVERLQAGRNRAAARNKEKGE